eukprot:TRINITY_DN14272_c2_g1_i1.p1 TRINITY_DN14272_c2_g1~~TRINITY_DN14272_c2_g1_i1.p1  ORF type:complete len:850 (-),score=151.34 TRINITY_DN14272_c2_g1_i1:371-2611(-)
MDAGGATPELTSVSCLTNFPDAASDALLHSSDIVLASSNVAAVTSQAENRQQHVAVPGARQNASSASSLGRRHPAVPPLPLPLAQDQNSCGSHTHVAARKAVGAPQLATASRVRSSNSRGLGRSSSAPNVQHSGASEGLRHNRSSGHVSPPKSRPVPSKNDLVRNSTELFGSAPSVTASRACSSSSSAGLRRSSPSRLVTTADHGAKPSVPSRCARDVSAPKLRASSPPVAVSVDRKASRSAGPYASTASWQARQALARQPSPARAASPSRAFAAGAGAVDARPKFRPAPRERQASPNSRADDALRRRRQAAATSNAPGEDAETRSAAAMALRRLLPMSQEGAATRAGGSRQMAASGANVDRGVAPIAAAAEAKAAALAPQTGVVTHNMALDDWNSIVTDESHMPELASTACSPSVQSQGCTAGAPSSSAVEERMRQLILENQALREAFGDTQKRLMQLEDERRGFMDEGIYDVVNSICGQSGGAARPRGSQLPGVSTTAAVMTPACESGAITYMLSGRADLAAIHCELPPRQQPLVRANSLTSSEQALSPGSAALALARKSEQDLRSAALSGENEELRRELERVTKVGEALEQQKLSAEDKAHALEQEHALLAQRLCQLQSPGWDGISEVLPPAERSAAANGFGSPTSPGYVAVARELADFSKVVSEELRAVERQDFQEEQAASPATSASAMCGVHHAQSPVTPTGCLRQEPSTPGVPAEVSPEEAEPTQPATKGLEPYELEDAW